MKSKYIIAILTHLFLIEGIWGQDFERSKVCQVNANAKIWSGNFLDQKNATVKIRFNSGGSSYGLCSGTLVSQFVISGKPKQYLILSSHCFRDASGLGENEIDWDLKHVVFFNYQSPNSVSTDGHENNWGVVNSESIPNPWLVNIPPATVPNGAINGYRFRLETQFNRIASNGWGDYAIIEIVEPIPPHFRPYFSGFSTGLFHGAPVVGYHHPAGDIKKLVKYPFVQSFDPWNYTCHIIGGVIDVFLNFFGYSSRSARRICRSISIPWYSGTAIEGSTEDGSSGSGIFRNWGHKKFIGALSGSWGLCNGNQVYYARHRDHYFTTKVRDVLNPSHSLSVDLNGINGRYIECYDALNLNGTYWPHAEHNQNGYNYVPISSSGEIRLASDEDGNNRFLWVMAGSEYDIKSGSGFSAHAVPNQQDNFYVQQGANLSLRVQEGLCTSQGKKESDDDAFMRQHMAKVRQIQLPPIGTNRYAQKLQQTQEQSLSIFPNPGHERLVFQWLLKDSGRLSLYNMQGLQVGEAKFLNERKSELNVSNLQNGVYIAVWQNEAGQNIRRKVVVQH